MLGFAAGSFAPAPAASFAPMGANAAPGAATLPALAWPATAPQLPSVLYGFPFHTNESGPPFAKKRLPASRRAEWAPAIETTGAPPVVSRKLPCRFTPVVLDETPCCTIGVSATAATGEAARFATSTLLP